MSLSRSPSPVSPPAYWSDSSDDFVPLTDVLEAEGSQPHSRPGTPESGVDAEDVATCRWADCGRVFNHLPTLIEHIHNDHIGVNKANYTCEWSTCSRRGLPQTSRFALISHLRSHTGEKPYVCTRPECDKSFTRSDALAKHLRLQHNIIMPPATRGGSRNRKRKRDVDDGLYPEGALSSFRVDENFASSSSVANEHHHHDSHSESNSPPPSPHSPFIPPTSVYGPQPGFVFMQPPEVAIFEDEENDPYIPPHLQQARSSETGLIYGRPPAMVAYIIQKAKYQMALQKHEDLLEDLKTWRGILEIQREEKDKVLDMVLAAEMGTDASKLVRKIHGPHWRPRLDDADPPLTILLPARYDVDTPAPPPTTQTVSKPPPLALSLPPHPQPYSQPQPQPPPPPIEIPIAQDSHSQRPMNLIFDHHHSLPPILPRDVPPEPMSRPRPYISLDKMIPMNGNGDMKRVHKRRRS